MSKVKCLPHLEVAALCAVKIKGIDLAQNDIFVYFLCRSIKLMKGTLSFILTSAIIRYYYYLFTFSDSTLLIVNVTNEIGKSTKY